MSRIFGGKDHFDDPFFTRPFGRSLFGSTMFDENAPSGFSSHVDKCKWPIIEELECDDGTIYDEEEMDGDEVKRDKYQESATNENPLVEHPEDQTDDHDKIKGKSSCKERSHRSASSDRGKLEGERPQNVGVSFQRVTYGGINGAYYTASTTRRAGKEGVMLEESREADTTTGQATHHISRGVHDKGHSVVRKLNSDGKVDTVQTLHNLDEGELANFERSWKGNADTHIPGWDYGSNFPSTVGAGESRLTSWSGWEVPFRNQFNRNAGFRTDPDTRAQSNEGRSRKVVTIPIE